MYPTNIKDPIAITAPGVEYPNEANRLDVLTILLLKYFEEKPSNIESNTVDTLTMIAINNVFDAN